MIFLYQKLNSSEAATENHSKYTKKLFYKCEQNYSQISENLQVVATDFTKTALL